MNPPLSILSIQSHVVYGHVGNSAAVFPLQRIGCEVWPIHTVQFSNHTGYPDWRGRVFDAGLIDDCVAGLAARGALARCDGVLSGYMGSPEIGAAIVRAVDSRPRCKSASGLLLRSRARRCRARPLCARRASPNSCASGRCPRRPS